MIDDSIRSLGRGRNMTKVSQTAWSTHYNGEVKRNQEEEGKNFKIGGQLK